MQIILGLLIFCIVLFLYLHIYFHLKTSDDLEIYEIDQPSKNKLEEICDIRQPVVFSFYNEQILNSCCRKTVLDIYSAFDVKIRNIQNEPQDDEELYIPIAFDNALKAINDDTESKYLIENNNDFLEETAMIKKYKLNDEFLRPYMVSNCNYDFNIASKGVRTPFKYEVNYRNYFYVTEGSIKIKLAPPRSVKYLSEVKDYDNFEFRSPVNPWNVQEQYKMDFDKIKCLEINLSKEQIIFIPAFWWYSIEYGEKTSLSVFKYRTYMNTISILPKLIIRFLQSQNVKRNTIPQIKNVIHSDNINENKDESVNVVDKSVTVVDKSVTAVDKSVTVVDKSVPIIKESTTTLEEVEEIK